MDFYNKDEVRVDSLDRQHEYSPTFFGRVMFYMALAVLTSLLGVWVGFTYLLETFLTNQMFIWIVFGAEILLILTSHTWIKKKPLGKVLFFIFAGLTGISITPLLLVAAATAGIGIILQALLATVLLFVAMGVIGWTTKKSLAGLGGFLMMALIGMIIVGIIGAFIPWGNTFETIYSGIGVLIMSGLVMYKFNILKSFPQDQYLMAAMSLYLSLFNMFVFVLRLILSQRS